MCARWRRTWRKIAGAGWGVRVTGRRLASAAGSQGAASRLPASVLRRLGGAGRARCSTVVGRSRGSLLSSGCQRPAAHHTCASDSRGKMLARRDEQAAAAMCFPRATGHDLRHTSRRQRQITHTGSRAWRCFALATAHGAQQEQALQSLSHAQPRGLWCGAACRAVVCCQARGSKAARRLKLHQPGIEPRSHRWRH